MNADTRQSDDRIPNICVNLRNLRLKSDLAPHERETPTRRWWHEEDSGESDHRRNRRGAFPFENGQTLATRLESAMRALSAETEDDWGVLKTTAIQDGEFQPEHNKRLPSALEPDPLLEVQEGDLLLTCAGPRVRCGVICLVRENAQAPDGVGENVSLPVPMPELRGHVFGGFSSVPRHEEANR